MRRILAAMVMVLMLIPVVNAGVIDGPARFLLITKDYSNRTEDLSLSLMALTLADRDLNGALADEIREMTGNLLERQNPDGGWGYFPGSTSNVPDTAYAVVSLETVADYLGPDERDPVERAAERGIGYIRGAFTGRGWGYVKGSRESCYPTVVSLWALGKAGYGPWDPMVSRAVDYLKDAEPCEISPLEFLALRTIALHSLGYRVDDSTVETIRETLLQGNPLPKERAMLTYALVLVAPADFDTLRALKKLRETAHVTNETMFWANPVRMLSSTDSIVATAYALMAFATPMHRRPSEPPENPYAMPCDDLKGMQNPDGGWGLVVNGPSNEKATHYSLLAIERCYPTNESIRKALNWTEKAFAADSLWVRENDRITPGYFYALETLLRHGLLSDEDKKSAIETVRNAQLYGGLWGIRALGPQPYDTALAVRALRDLGVPANDPLIQAAVEWLLSISNGGWGTYVTTPHFSYMLKPDVLTTVTVLEALDGIATREELEPHLRWLVDQRVDGGWAYWRDSWGRPSVELTVRATDLLSRYGYNYTRETLEFVMNARDSGLIEGRPIETAFTVLYLSRFHYVPQVTLYDVRNALDTDLFEVIAPHLDNRSLSEILAALREDFGDRFVVANTTEIGYGNYIVIARFGDYNVRKYNPYLRFHLNNGSVTVGNVTVPVNSSVVLVPGKTPGGVVLFVFYSPPTEDIAIEVFTTGFVEYISGSAMVLVREGDRVRLLTVG
ncbi:prenyltransferase/squalene oxidase repeat-containing protein [Thermococcus sp.]|uniref:prenyltransferase/squalene oxidase repeat-containing protein n=1 Tax=Thermococcus sp. TaxID=35749 RepID=UPI002628D448|nr:prenyltransferase/squalene oxidase repeat-containing protein [Thermococcus sp.]